ncbi:MAG: zinc-dependent peptidase [Deltaproteobacteria bacterium]|nr:zinc-dependent peptidase [Deltaproteobacteria bacterium]
MVFDWLRRRRRERILADPFPDAWRQTLGTRVAAWADLDDDERTLLCQLTQVFVEEKNWEGLGGLEMDDDVRVTVAGQACLLILGLDHDLYRRVESILVYPSTVFAPAEGSSIFGVATAPVSSPMPLLGQAWQRGPVILAWDAVRRGAADSRDGHNVVFHEFAHKLDMLSGGADGVPPLADRETYDRWVQVFERGWHALHERQAAGRRTFLDAYAGESPAEFFAVATEQFFEQGAAMEHKHPALYDVLRDFYRQDPARRRNRRTP